MATSTYNFAPPGLRANMFGNMKYGSSIQRGLGLEGTWNPHTASMFATGAPSLHAAGMGGAYNALGLGNMGLFDVASYSAGLKGSASEMTIGERFAARATRHGGKMPATMLAEGAAYKEMGGMLREAFANKPISTSFHVAGRALGPIATMMAMRDGFRQGGVRGAISGGVSSIAEQYALGIVQHALIDMGGIGTLGFAAVGAAGVYGGYQFAKASRNNYRKSRAMEMGGPFLDPFGNSATMRQRGLQALQSSQLNGRSAFGTEAQLMHVPAMR